MDVKLPINENLETLFENLQKFLRTETVVGQPTTIGEVTIVPIISASFGCGAGGGGGKGIDSSKGGDGLGAGLGAGAKISADAILVIKKDEVTMLPVKSKAGFEKVIEAVPELLSKINIKKDEECCKEEIK